MMANKKKKDAKSIASQKRGRRRLLSFVRMIKYGLDSFTRNSWLSVAATAVMTITLLIIFTTFSMQNILTDTVSSLGEKVDMSIYLKTDTTDEVGAQIVSEVKKLSSVRSATYCSAECGRAKIAQENSDDNSILSALNEATNKNPAVINVVVNNINDTFELENFVKNNKLVKDNLSTEYEPSFAGDRRNTIKSIGRAVGFAQKVGIVAGAIFVVISALIIFNTIRMAIFNRSDEIEMMKLIGADKRFIRGPFLVEATIYGCIAAIIATALGIFALYKVSPTLISYQITIQPTIDLVTKYCWLVLIAMILIGSLIGIVSSWLATRRYLSSKN